MRIDLIMHKTYNEWWKYECAIFYIDFKRVRGFRFENLSKGIPHKWVEKDKVFHHCIVEDADKYVFVDYDNKVIRGR